MSAEDWDESFARAVTVALSGDTGDPTRPDDPFLILINAWWEPLAFTVPDSLRALGWKSRDRHRRPGSVRALRRPVGRRQRD